ncbi:MAG: TIGR00725 family protein [Kiloniellales bacterium]
MLAFNADRSQLISQARSFDPWNLVWGENRVPDGSIAASPQDALAWLFAQPRVRRVPLAVIGPKAASEQQRNLAEALGRRLAELGMTMITGGRGGVMEAASRGHLDAGGLPIGILPDDEWQSANDYVALPLATGVGVARNAIIARAAFALIAIGGEYGTLSEMALGLHFKRLVIGLNDAPQVQGAVYLEDIDQALDRVALRLFALER